MDPQWHLRSESNNPTQCQARTNLLDVIIVQPVQPQLVRRVVLLILHQNNNPSPNQPKPTDRCVCADSYFTSVNAVTVLRMMGLRFIGVVKMATKKFPMSYLSNLELVQCGDYKGLVARGTDGQPTMLSFVWMDWDRRYFIASTSSLDSGIPYSRNRWCQVPLELDALPENVELTIPQPKATEVYYRTCGVIDQHNRHRQDNFKTEKKLETKNWDMRVNLTIFSMIVVDTWLVYSQATGSTELQSEFYVRLAEELIDNNIDSRPQ